MEPVQTTENKCFPEIPEFIEKQKQLLALDFEEEKNETTRIYQESSLTLLEEMGLCLTKLIVTNIKEGLYGKTLVTFSSPLYNKTEMEKNDSLQKKLNEKFQRHKFSPGDLVGVYDYVQDKSTKLENKSVTDGVIYKVKPFKLIVSMKDQDSVESLNKGEFTLAMIANEITYQRHLKALESIEKAYTEEKGPHPSNHLLKVCFGKESPEEPNPTMKERKKVKLSELTIVDKSLNDEQKEAIVHALNSETVYLIHGPPGTGKTKTICEFIRQCVRLNLKVLATAPSNIAVDNIVERLAKTDVKCCRIGHPARLLPTVKENCLDSLLTKNEYYKELRNSKRQINQTLMKLAKTRDREERYDLKALLSATRADIRTLEKSATQSTLDNAQVILCTNTGAGEKIIDDYINRLPSKSFDVVVIDECAQALEVSCWIPLLRGKKTILAGDHNQLPPTIKSRDAEKKGLNVTLFERIIDGYGEPCSTMLRVQYRMNKMIMEWASQEVYKGRLLADPSVQDHNLDDLRQDKSDGASDTPVLTLIDTFGCQMGENKVESEGLMSHSKYNEGEASLVKVLILEFKEKYPLTLQEADIGVITPYNAQAELIRKELAKCGLEKIEVSTVDGFQGREKEIIIISMVRSNPQRIVGFLSEYRRMNVAVTRAKRHAAIICNSDTVKSDKFLKNLVEYFEKHGDFRTANEFEGDSRVAFGKGVSLGAKFKDGGANQGAGQGAAQAKKKKKADKKPTKDSKQPSQGGMEERKIETLPKNTAQSQSGDEDRRLKELLLRVDNFLKDPTKNSLEMPADLTSYHRMRLHEYADQKNLIHESKGEGKDRHIVLEKKVKAESKGQEKPQDQGKALPDNKEEEDDEEEEEKENNAGEAQGENKKKKKKKKKKKTEEKPPENVQVQDKPATEHVGKSKKDKKEKKPNYDDMDDMEFLEMMRKQNEEEAARQAQQGNPIDRGVYIPSSINKFHESALKHRITEKLQTMQKDRGVKETKKDTKKKK